MRKIVFIVESTFNNRDYHRFGIEVFKNRGYEVEVWDLTPLLRPEYFSNYTPPDPIDFDGHRLIHDKSYAGKLISELSGKHLSICLMGIDTRNRFVYDHLSKNKIKYGFLLLGLIPSKRNSFLCKVQRVLESPSQAATRIFGKIRKNASRIDPPHFLVVGGSDAIRNGRYPIGYRTRIINAHALDYDRYLEEEERASHECQGVRYAVFLDEWVPHHPDYLHERGKPDCTAEQYYPPLNKFFDNLEDELALEVIIAAHPRARYDEQSNPFGGRSVVFGKTIQLVRDSQLVLAHASTAINFAVLYEKPIIFLCHSSYRRSYREYIWRMASVFGKKPIELSRPFATTLTQELKVDGTIYYEYKSKYIKETGTPEKPIWEIFIDYCRELGYK